MKLFKKIAFTGFVGLSALTLAACGEEEANNPVEPTEPEESVKVYEELNSDNLKEFFSTNYEENFKSLFNGTKVLNVTDEETTARLRGDTGTEKRFFQLGLDNGTLKGYSKYDYNRVGYYYNYEDNKYVSKKSYTENSTSYSYVNGPKTEIYHEYDEVYESGSHYKNTSYEVEKTDGYEYLQYLSYIDSFINSESSLLDGIDFDLLKTELETVAKTYSAKVMTNLLLNYIEPAKDQQTYEAGDPEAKTVIKINTAKLAELFGFDSKTMEVSPFTAKDVIDGLVGDKTAEGIVNDIVALVGGESTKLTSLNTLVSSLAPQLLPYIGAENADDLETLAATYLNYPITLPEEASMYLMLLGMADVRVELYTNVKKYAIVAEIPNPEKPDTPMTFELSFEVFQDDLGATTGLQLSLVSEMIGQYVLSINLEDENTIVIDFASTMGNYKVVLTKTETGLNIVVNSVEALKVKTIVPVEPKVIKIAEINLTKVDAQTVTFGVEIVGDTKFDVTFKLDSKFTLNINVYDPIIKTENNQTTISYRLDKTATIEFSNKEIKVDSFNIDSPTASYGEVYDENVGTKEVTTISFVDKFDADLVNEVTTNIAKKSNIIDFTEANETKFTYSNSTITPKENCTYDVWYNSYEGEMNVTCDSSYKLADASYYSKYETDSSISYTMTFEKVLDASITLEKVSDGSGDAYEFKMNKDGELELTNYYKISNGEKTKSNAYDEDILEELTRYVNKNVYAEFRTSIYKASAMK